MDPSTWMPWLKPILVWQTDEAALERLKLMVNGAQEVVGLDHLISVLAGGPSMAGDDVIRCCVGFEPSGTAHIGWKCSPFGCAVARRTANVMVFGGLARLGQRQI